MEVLDRRLKLDAMLREILGSNNVYFQPPEGVRMKYPAIKYERNRVASTSADNIIYKQDISYMITCIYTDPDDDLPLKISRIPKCRHDRPYIADGLIHDVYELYF